MGGMGFLTSGSTEERKHTQPLRNRRAANREPHEASVPQAFPHDLQAAASQHLPWSRRGLKMGRCCFHASRAAFAIPESLACWTTYTVIIYINAEVYLCDPVKRGTGIDGEKGHEGHAFGNACEKPVARKEAPRRTVGL